MNLFKKIPFIYDKNEYEIRVLYDEKTINIVPFYKNHPATGIRYQILIPKKVNTEKILDLDKFSDFIQLAKNDVIEKRWKGFADLFKKGLV